MILNEMLIWLEVMASGKFNNGMRIIRFEWSMFSTGELIEDTVAFNLVASEYESFVKIGTEKVGTLEEISKQFCSFFNQRNPVLFLIPK